MRQVKAARRFSSSTVRPVHFNQSVNRRASRLRNSERDAEQARTFTRRLRTALDCRAKQDLVRLPRGRVLYRCGEVSNSLYLVESGRIKTASFSPCGKGCLLDIYAPGEVVGECCLHGAERTDTATAMAPTLLRRIPKERFLQILVECELLDQWMGYLAARLSTQQRLITLLVTVESEQRLAVILLRLARKLGIPQGELIRVDERITQQELAEMVGTTRSRVGLFLKRFRDSGYIGSSTLASPLVVHEGRLADYVGEWS